MRAKGIVLLLILNILMPMGSVAEENLISILLF